MIETARRWLRIILKTLGFVLATSLYSIYSLIGDLVIRDPIRKRRFFVNNMTLTARVLLAILRIRVSVICQSQPPQDDPESPEGHLIVSNHLSYTDVLVITSWLPSVFITSVEVQKTPVLGFWCKCAGSLFVERRSRAGLPKEIGQIASVLKDGFNVALFPEATSTNGDSVIPFKRALFDSAIQAKKKVLALCINYTHADGIPVDKGNRDSVFYYGDAQFHEHFIKLAGLREVRVELRFLEAIDSSAGLPSGLMTDKHALAERSHSRIQQAYHLNGALGEPALPVPQPAPSA